MSLVDLIMCLRSADEKIMVMVEIDDERNPKFKLKSLFELKTVLTNANWIALDSYGCYQMQAQEARL